MIDHTVIGVADIGHSAAFHAAFVLDPDGNNMEAVFRGDAGGET